ncbi:MAG: glycosyltransferase family 4 protein [Flavipsychrobacter sp.]
MNAKKKILVVSFQSLTANSAGGMARLGYYLSKELHQRNLLEKFIVFSKGKHTTDFPCEPVSKWSRYYLFLLNKLNQFLKIPAHKFRLIQEQQYDRFCTQHITKDIGILFTTNAHMRRTFKKAKRLGIPIVYIPANQEENYIYDLITKEQNLLGIHNTDAYTYQPRLQFYNQSIGYVDTVIGTYPTVYDSYVNAARKSYEVVNITGHLKPDFKPYTLEERTKGATFHVGYMAHTVVLKGLQYLLTAWKELQEENKDLNIELSVAGYIEPKLKDYIAEHFGNLKKIKYLGHVSSVPEFLKTLDIFVIPSLSEGGPYTALEAAHYGVPVIITENCGSGELLSRDNSGCVIIPIRDAGRIKQEVLNAYNNRAALPQMGINAKTNLDNYKMQELFTALVDYLEKKVTKL